MLKKQVILGIDLGTTYSLACMRIENEIRFFTPESGGDPLMPSVFLHKGNDEICVGGEAVAEENFEKHRSHVIRHVKRLMKRNYDREDAPAEKLASHEKSFSPAEVSGRILRRLKEAAEEDIRKRGLGPDYDWTGAIYSAVITVPAYFGADERDATRDAAKYAGFSPSDVNLHLLDEPVAAALSLGLHQEKGRKLILVVDVGGGTTDISLLKVGTEVENGGFFELGRIGDAELGGIDIDEKIVRKTIYDPDNPAAHYSADEKHALQDKHFQGSFFQRAEAEKKKVCREMKEKKGVFGEVRYREPQKNKLFEFKFDEAWFRRETEDIIEYCAQLCDCLLANVDRSEAGVGRGRGITWKKVDQLWLVGGSSLMPHLQERLMTRLRNPAKLQIAPRPQHAVAEGAAIYADMLARKQALKGIAMPRCPYDIGVEVLPRRSRWSRLKQWIRRIVRGKNLAGNKPLAREFYPLIECNTSISDTKPLEQTFDFPVKPGKDGQARCRLCIRYVSRTPAILNGAPIGESQGRQAKVGVNYVVQGLRRVTIPNFPVAPDCSPNIATITVKYDANHTFRLGGWYRGRKLEEIVIRGGEFDIGFEEKE